MDSADTLDLNMLQPIREAYGDSAKNFPGDRTVWPAWTTIHGLTAASSMPTRFVIHVSGAAGGPVDKGYAPFLSELKKRGFPSMLVHSSVKGSDTPNEDRASAVVQALQNVTDQVAIFGISNEANFLP